MVRETSLDDIIFMNKKITIGIVSLGIILLSSGCTAPPPQEGANDNEAIKLSEEIALVEVPEWSAFSPEELPGWSVTDLRELAASEDSRTIPQAYSASNENCLVNIITTFPGTENVLGNQLFLSTKYGYDNALQSATGPQVSNETVLLVDSNEGKVELFQLDFSYSILPFEESGEVDPSAVETLYVRQANRHFTDEFPNPYVPPGTEPDALGASGYPISEVRLECSSVENIDAAWEQIIKVLKLTLATN